MKPGLGAAIVAVGLSLGAGTAFAQRTRAQHGAIDLGLRVGYALPTGQEGETSFHPNNASVSSDVSGVVPIIVDAGYRFIPNFYLGLSFQYAPGSVNTDTYPLCGRNGVSCSASDVRLDVNAHYHVAPGQAFDPWLGVGLGYEWLSLSGQGTTGSLGLSANGFELADFQFGCDFRVAPDLGLGPFLSISLGEYQNASVTLTNTTVATDVTNQSMHAWFAFGLRGVYEIPL